MDKLTSVHPCEHVIRTVVAFQHILVDDILVSSLGDFLLEEDEKITVVVGVSKITLKLGLIIQVLNHLILQRWWWPLV